MPSVYVRYAEAEHAAAVAVMWHRLYAFVSTTFMGGLTLVDLGCYASCRDAAVQGSPCIICVSLHFPDENMRVWVLSWGFLIFLLSGKTHVAQGVKHREIIPVRITFFQNQNLFPLTDLLMTLNR